MKRKRSERPPGSLEGRNYEGHIPKNQYKKGKTSSNTLNKPKELKEKAFSSSFWKFDTDYNDHFETPTVAYVDIIQLLRRLANVHSTSLADLRVYDPYFCKGTLISTLKSLGLSQIINENRDFYNDIKKRTVPDYDILVTNPPYSGEHKQLLLNYLKSPQHNCRPFALLLPAYTATKSYWKDFIQQSNSNRSNATNSKSPSTDIRTFYLMPPDSYSYDHPEGTGKDTPPFYSCWFLGNFPLTLNSVRGLYPSVSTSQTSQSVGRRALTVLETVEDMVTMGYVTSKRPNPKRRKKLKTMLTSA